MHRALRALFGALVLVGSCGVTTGALTIGTESGCENRPATILGTPGDDRLVGTSGADVIVGLGGDDELLGLDGDDVLCGGAGSDRITPGSGDDMIDGGPGSDLVLYRAANSPVLVDLVSGTAVGSGNDGLRSIERVVGSPFGDVIIGTRLAEVLEGRGGADRIEGAGGGDVIRGGGGDDQILGTPGASVSGGRGADACEGGTSTSCESGAVPDVRWVSPTGDDGADGASPTDAFATIEVALEFLDQGGTVYVLPGTHSGGVLFEGADTPIRITGIGGRPTLDGGQTRPLGLFCTECNGLTVEWLTIRGYTDIGVGATLSSDVVLRHLRIIDNGHRVQLHSWELEGYGIHVDGSIGLLIERNVAVGNGPSPPSGSLLVGTAINTYDNRGVVIRDNRIHHNHGAGILVEDSHDVLVEGNEVYENDLDVSAQGWWDGAIWVDGGSDVTIRGNLIRENRGVGLQISDEERQSPTGYVVDRNAITANFFGIYLWNFGTSTWPSPAVVRFGSGNTVRDNLCRDVWIEPEDGFIPCP